MRGVMYVIWGDKHVCGELAYRSVSSVKKYGYPTCLLTDKETNVEDGFFDQIIRIDFPDNLGNLSRKSLMFEYSPFESTLFLDDDTVILDDLSFGWEMAEKHSLAISMAPAFLLPPNGKESHRDMIYYNTGVIFFKKNHSTENLFKSWKQMCVESKNTNDQPPFCWAVYNEGFNPFVLPHTWNFRGHFGKILWIHGGLKIWHSRREVPPEVPHWNYCNSRHYQLLMPGFARVMGKGGGQGLGLFWQRPHICEKCGNVKRSASDLQPPLCRPCNIRMVSLPLDVEEIIIGIKDVRERMLFYESVCSNTSV